MTVTNEGTNEVHTVVADSEGHYIVPNLPPATYSMTVEAKGFSKFVSVHNALGASTALAIDGALKTGAVSDTIEVTATAVVLQTESGALQSEISGKTIQDQQLNGRNPLYMGSLIPGMRSGTTLGDFSFAVGSSIPFNVNGARPQDTLLTFDGAPGVRTRGSGQIIGVPNPDAIEEEQILTSDYQAEYGSSAGGQIRIVSKSGTRDFHASAYEFLRNSAMNANDWVRNHSATTRFATPFRYNNFGFTFGGPVIIPGVQWTQKFRQKMFFFVAEDWIRYRYTDTQQQAVPTALMRTGNFSELLQANPWYPTGTKVYDPSTCPAVGAAGCVQYTNNTIPNANQSANGMAIIDAYPIPTPGYLSGTNNWIAQAAHPINQRKQQISFDLVINDHHKLSFRRQNVTYNEYIPFDQGSGLTGRYFNRPNQTNGLTWTWLINQSTVNEARVTYSLDQVYIPVNTALPGFNRGVFGINFPYIIPGQKAAENKIPTVSGLGNFYGLAGGPYPSHSGGPIYTYSDSFTKVLGNHTIKLGVEVQDGGENDNDQINVSTVPGGANNQNGNFTFSDSRSIYGATTGVALANLAYGLSDYYTEIGPKSYTVWRGQVYEWFAQDSWKVNQRLHLDYGLRYTALTPYKAAWGNAAFFDPTSYSAASAPPVSRTTGNVTLGVGNPYDGMVIPGYSSFPASAAAHGVVGATASTANTACDNGPCTKLFAPNIRNGYVNLSQVWQPRVGFAYEITPKTVIRGGFGEFATRMGLLDNIFPGGNPPFQPFITVNSVSGDYTDKQVDNPGYSLLNTTAPALTVTTLDKNLRAPIRYNWNIAAQRELPLKSMLTVAYVGGHGIHNWRVYDINQVPAGTTLANPGVNLSALRPYQGYAAIQQERSDGRSRYNSLQVSWQRTSAKNISFGVAYTLSKSMDDSSNYRDIVPDTYNVSNLYGPSEYDARHMLVINYVWALPFYRDQTTLPGRLLGGWRIAGVAQFQTGAPCGIGTNNNDFAGVGEQGSFGCGSEGQFWLMSEKPKILHNFAGYTGQTGKYFSTTNATGQSIFTQPAAGTFNLQQGVRDSIYQPGYQDWNLSLKKKFAITQAFSSEFTVDAYNFINHPNWAGPNLNPTSSQFGEVTSKSASNPRTLQVGLHFVY